jgi:hypothetical protein
MIGNQAFKARPHLRTAPRGQGADGSVRTNGFQLEKKCVAAAERSGSVKRWMVGLRHRLTMRLPAPFAALTSTSTARFSRAAPATSRRYV